MGPWRDRALPRALLLLLAFAALVGHVCAEDAGAHHALAATTSSPGHTHPAESGLHAASCQGLKPDPTGTIGPMVGAWIAPTAMAMVRASSVVSEPADPGRRSALYLLHASLRL